MISALFMQFVTTVLLNEAPIIPPHCFAPLIVPEMTSILSIVAPNALAIRDATLCPEAETVMFLSFKFLIVPFVTLENKATESFAGVLSLDNVLVKFVMVKLLPSKMPENGWLSSLPIQSPNSTFSANEISLIITKCLFSNLSPSLTALAKANKS